MIKHRLSFLLKLSLGALAMGFSVMGGGCAQTPPAVKSMQLPAQSFTTQWTLPLTLKGDEVTNLFVKDDYVFVYTRKHVSLVVDRASGVLRYATQVTRSDVTMHPPVVLKDYIVYPTTGAMEVYTRGGKLVKDAPLHDLAVSTDVVGEGTRVFFGADVVGGGRLVALDLAGDQYQLSIEKWQLLTRGGLSASPAIYQGLLYIGDHDGDVYAVNADTRKAIWPMEQPGREEGVFGADGACKAPLEVDEYGLYVASMDTKLYCLDRTSGVIRWQYFSGTPLNHAPTVTPSTVYQFVDNMGLVALEKIVTRDKHDQKPKWVVPDAIAFLAEDDKYAYLRRKDNIIMAVEKSTGQVKFTSNRKDLKYFGNTHKGATIYAVTADGVVMAITPVLKAGQVGELVLNTGPQPSVALAAR